MCSGIHTSPGTAAAVRALGPGWAHRGLWSPSRAHSSRLYRGEWWIKQIWLKPASYSLCLLKNGINLCYPHSQHFSVLILRSKLTSTIHTGKWALSGSKNPVDPLCKSNLRQDSTHFLAFSSNGEREDDTWGLQDHCEHRRCIQQTLIRLYSSFPSAVTQVNGHRFLPGKDITNYKWGLLFLPRFSGRGNW